MKKNSILLVISALLMTSCATNKSDTSSTGNGNSSNATISNTSENIQDETSSVSSSDDNKENSDSSSTVIDYESLDEKNWGLDIVSLMKDHLNQVIPYVRLANRSSQLYANFDAKNSRLTIIGEEITSSETYVENAKSTYDNRVGWDTSDSTKNTFVAKKESSNIKVTIQKGKDENDGLIVLYADYKEPYDETSATSWDENIIKAFKNNLNNYSDIPFVYLGVRVPTIDDTLTSTTKMSLIGGNWKDDILINANTAFSKANENISDENLKWALDLQTTQFTAKMTFSDKSTITVNLIHDPVSDKAIMNFNYKDGFKVPDNGDWTDSIKSAFNDVLGGHTIPYIYLGTLNPILERANDNTIEISGDIYDDQILTLAENALKADTNDGTYNVTVDEANKKVTANKTCTNNDSLTFTLSIKNNKPNIVVSNNPNFELPTSEDERQWPNLLTRYINMCFDKHSFPWFYLNNKKDAVFTSTNMSNSKDNRSVTTLNVGNWDERIIKEMKKIYDADTSTKSGWKYSENIYQMGPSMGGTIYSEEATYDDGCKINIRINHNPYTTTCTVTYTEGFKAPTGTDAIYSDSVKQSMNGTLKEVLPYIYLGSKTPTATTSNNYLKLVGGAWDDQIIDLFKSAFTTDLGWNITETTTSSSPCYVARKKNNSNNTEIKVILTKGSTTLDCYYCPALNISTTSWNDNTIQLFKDNFGEDISFPYIYLGNTSYNTEYLPNYSDVRMSASSTNYKNNDLIVENMRTVLTNLNNEDEDTSNDWVFTEKETNYGTTLVAKRTNQNGIYFMKLEGTYIGYDLYCSYAQTTIPTGDEAVYSDNVLATINVRTKNHPIPFIYLNARKDKVISNNNYSEYAEIKGGKWTDSIFDNVIIGVNEANKTISEDELKWNYSRDYSNNSIIVTSSVKDTNSDGKEETHHITITVVKDSLYETAQMRVFYH